MSADDERLMAEARKSENMLLNFFVRHGVSPSESEDLVQETYLRLWKYRKAYHKTAKLSTFLCLLARQVRIDALRRRMRREAREESWIAERPDEDVPKTYGVREDVLWAVSQLSGPLREVVELGVFRELPYAEIGDILRIPVGTVKSRMSNALKKLKEMFDEETTCYWRATRA